MGNFEWPLGRRNKLLCQRQAESKGDRRIEISDAKAAVFDRLGVFVRFTVRPAALNAAAGQQTRECTGMMIAAGVFAALAKSSSNLSSGFGEVLL